MSDNHTPAPWKLHKMRTRIYINTAKGTLATLFLRMAGLNNFTAEEIEANALLIAAAPELKAAAKYAFVTIAEAMKELGIPLDTAPALVQLSNAINKSEGKK